MNKLFEQLGRIALGSRLRMLTETITRDSARIYAQYGIDLHPKWFPVFYVLSQQDSLTITAAARAIGHSHPSVSKIVREMKAAGLAEEMPDPRDGRRTRIRLTEQGRQIAERISDQYLDVEQAIGQLSAQTNNDLWAALGEWEYLLEQKSLLQRVTEARKMRESGKVTIIDYTPAHREVFRELNEAWISAYFKIEEADRRALGDPEGYILKKGGHILVACYNGDPIGVCALIRMDDPDYQFELAKMAVSPEARGKNIGFLLGQAIKAKARELGAHKLYLESNTRLKPAIGLYQKLGFRKISGRSTPYERCDIQMDCAL
ncbi:MarR family transcriptional regulator [Pedobacter yulinensis]|uniref:MarR family transcriptional regulator n=1 Tax=Pedobacter yulinensis TaxID=2126353 RepID=A0A2T3HI56_9SPHI|nr:bifunctional helix-turn-helix transcriptional regulator/GNAT family N-acetyltransferase [Pedobacter yulinensis]PST82083.1 MarR family transcriptional regulator [Pedobacter yulinensis]